MNDDYLWDGSGEPDPEIKSLEATLGRFRLNRPAPEFDEIFPARARSFQSKSWHTGSFTRWAAAAAILLVVAAFSFIMRRTPTAPPSGAGWKVASLAGTPHVGNKVIVEIGDAGKLMPGQTLETDSRSRASITDESTGEVQIEPDTRLRLLEATSARKQLALDHGTIHAFIWSPPGEFVVDTPSAVTVDLGCAYTLHVDDSGAGLLRTTLGWVGFKLQGRESFIPAGAACATRPRIGPGTPYYEDASEPFCEALARFDFGTVAAIEKDSDVTIILAESRRRDALTLWHLLSRVGEPDRGRVYDRLGGFVPPPAAVTREGVLRLDQRMLDAWWNKMGLGDISLWRTWERSWTQRDSGKKP
jgi:hypothetical protein